MTKNIFQSLLLSEESTNTNKQYFYYFTDFETITFVYIQREKERERKQTKISLGQNCALNLFLVILFCATFLHSIRLPRVKIKLRILQLRPVFF